MKNMINWLKSKQAQSAVEYLLIFTVVAIVVLIAFRDTFPNVHIASKTFHDDVSDVIRGENAQAIDGQWCSWGDCVGGYERRECMCPQPAFGGAFCGATQEANGATVRGIRQCEVYEIPTIPGAPEKGACTDLPDNAYPCPGTEYDMYTRDGQGNITGPLYLKYRRVPACVNDVRAAVPKCKFISCSSSGMIVNNTLSGCTACGNGRIDAGEECDESVEGRNLGCDACQCDAVRYRPLEGGGCLLVCGNGIIDEGEECESGVGCNVTTCTCDNGYVPLDGGGCNIGCGNGKIDEGEQCDFGGEQVGQDGYTYTCTSGCSVRREKVCSSLPENAEYYPGDDGWIEVNNCLGETGSSVNPQEFSCDQGWQAFSGSGTAIIQEITVGDAQQSNTNHPDIGCEFRCKESYQWDGSACI